MTATELQRIALHLSNSGWCRHWLHWNYDRRDPWLMAIQVLDARGHPVSIPELAYLGFKGIITEVYVIERTDEDGTPFRSDL